MPRLVGRPGERLHVPQAALRQAALAAEDALDRANYPRVAHQAVKDGAGEEQVAVHRLLARAATLGPPHLRLAHHPAVRLAVGVEDARPVGRLRRAQALRAVHLEPDEAVCGKVLLQRRHAAAERAHSTV